MQSIRASMVALILGLAGCSSTITSPQPVPHPSTNPGPSIQHVIVLFQENRSLNTMFMNFPGADTTTSGPCKPYKPPGHKIICTTPGQRVTLHRVKLETCGLNPSPCIGGNDIEHSHATFESEFDAETAGVPKMDGFDTIGLGTTGQNGPALFYPYAYVDPKEIHPYWDMAAQYTLGDHMFSTSTSDSFPAHQQIIAGTTELNSHESLIDTPSTPPWGCDNTAKSTTTGIILTNGKVEPSGGPFPCLTQYKTMADVLDAAGVSWKYYVASYDSDSPYLDFSGSVWDAFDAIKSVRYGPDWKNVSIPNTNVLNDIKKGTLPQVSWVIPILAASDHPAAGNKLGPSWVAAVVNAVGKSQYWKNTAVIVLWDEWGGWYDNVPPPQLDYTSLGMRVPMIVVSPFAKRHHVSKTQYEFGSVLKFIEQNFGAGSLGKTDVRATSIGDVFDFTQKVRPFKTISAPYPPTYFYEKHPGPSMKQIIDEDGAPPG